ncbi:MAG TPA: thiamine-phosphate kinase [Terracidiphilus sp.]|nr:thiamine-phosphate kinase [Terracidiphilus sp.]
MRAKQNKPARAAAGGERALLARIRERARGSGSPPGIRLGIGDDCALLRARPGEEFAVTTDLSIAGRHFRLDAHPPEAVGHRTLARGLSDLAAMGARPLAAFLSLGLPRELTRAHGRGRAWVERFMDGLMALAESTGTPLAGGDLAESPLAVADIVLVGAVPRGRALLRSGARPGDGIYVTGALGGSAAGLERLMEIAGLRSNTAGRGRTAPTRNAPTGNAPTGNAPLAPHLFPQPRLAQGLFLQRRGVATAALASAAIDLSDGLSTDLAHLCEESGVAAEVEAARLPISFGATLEQALNGGEDYELLFTAKPEAKLPRAIGGIPITRIGRMVRAGSRKPRVQLKTAQGHQPLEAKGWEHFSG